jgi:hypothetical protein
MILLALLIGIANPIPSAYLKIAVLIPIREPSILRRGPPLLPGLIEASNWINSL